MTRGCRCRRGESKAAEEEGSDGYGEWVVENNAVVEVDDRAAWPSPANSRWFGGSRRQQRLEWERSRCRGPRSQGSPAWASYARSTTWTCWLWTFPGGDDSAASFPFPSWRSCRSYWRRWCPCRASAAPRPSCGPTDENRQTRGASPASGWQEDREQRQNARKRAGCFPVVARHL